MPREQTPGDSPREERLTSWKSIARYLGRDVRTAMRWEKEAGMPVHRVPGRGPRGPVFGYPAELDAWLRGEGGPEAPAAPRGAPVAWIAPAAALVLAGAALAVWLGPGPGTRVPEPATEPGFIRDFVVQGAVLRGLDRSGKEVLSLTHPEGREFVEGSRAVRVTPGGEALRWIVAANVLVGPSASPEEGELFAVEDGERIAWRRRFPASLRFGAGAYGPLWVSQTLAAVRGRSGPLVAWAVRHQTWWPSVLLLVDPGGEVLGQFANAGWIERVVAADMEGAERIFAGGINNARASAMLAVLLVAAVGGSSPEDEASGFACEDCTEGAPERYFVFGRTDVNLAVGLPYNRTLDVVVTDEGIQVWVQEGPRPSDVAWIYTIAPDFASVRAAASDSYWTLHDALHASGALDHPGRECPERVVPPPVGVWTPGVGWRTLAVPPLVTVPPGR